MSKIYKTAVYLRLSRDDESENESGSIANQRQMLMSFIDGKDDLKFVREFVDDGYSGYDFNRPQFVSMIEAAENGEIDCIVVKDFSRLGRNFQKTEEYTQRIFPKLGIRFIAVNNCYDSCRELSAAERLANPVINLMNEYHVMETSQKIRAVFEHYRQIGKFIGSHAPYGYIIKNKQLEVDEVAAEIVRKIFDMKIDGYSNQGIADYLNDNGINSPLEHKIESGIKATGENFKKGKKAIWQSMSVRRILENPVYIGSLVQGKTTSVSYRDRRRFKKDPSELTVFENSHEAIISDTAFFIVQDLLSRDSYTKVQKRSYLFSGFAFCGNCKNVLYHVQTRTKKVIWTCRNTECTCKKNIDEDVLIQTIFTILKSHIDTVINHSSVCDINEITSDCNSNLKISELKKQEEQYRNSLEKLKNQAISQIEYQDLVDFYNAKIAGIKNEQEEFIKQKTDLLKYADEIKENYNSYVEAEELTRKLLVSFVERIEVVDKKKIRIFFRYENIFKKKDGE